MIYGDGGAIVWVLARKPASGKGVDEVSLWLVAANLSSMLEVVRLFSHVLAA
jgi:hypothetical protein